MLAALAVFAAFGVYAAADGLWPGEHQDALLVPATPVARAPLRLRCETCGVIEAIRVTEAAGGRPVEWTFIVRLRNGSLRQSRAPLPGGWQVGDHIQLIGGDRAWSLP